LEEDGGAVYLGSVSSSRLEPTLIVGVVLGVLRFSDAVSPRDAVTRSGDVTVF
jgi:hypothetical protein